MRGRARLGDLVHVWRMGASERSRRQRLCHGGVEAHPKLARHQPQQEHPNNTPNKRSQRCFSCWCCSLGPKGAPKIPPPNLAFRTVRSGHGRCRGSADKPPDGTAGSDGSSGGGGRGAGACGASACGERRHETGPPSDPLTCCWPNKAKGKRGVHRCPFKGNRPW